MEWNRVKTLQLLEKLSKKQKKLSTNKTIEGNKDERPERVIIKKPEKIVIEKTVKNLEKINPKRDHCICSKGTSGIPKVSKERTVKYPEDDDEIEIRSKTFHLKYKKNLSLTAKFILKSFPNKYIYYAIDDILYFLSSNSNERDNLLAVLYSPILSLQNNFSVNFFDIWIDEVSIDEVPKTNKFLTKKSQILQQDTFLTIEFFYKVGMPVKKEETLW